MPGGRTERAAVPMDRNEYNKSRFRTACGTMWPVFAATVVLQEADKVLQLKPGNDGFPNLQGEINVDRSCQF